MATTSLSDPDFSFQPYSTNDHALADLAALTGLFNPALLVDELLEPGTGAAAEAAAPVPRAKPPE
ncbi:hypothetical protein K3G63_04130 [Hymenobacter sp. HSC-4F20]|uniref:hypothetical protein n=1 Tax=Hymenobacter sp. HSC-4F20 TaxID=2864135 RepID=UPI001C7339C1|nr:hypothetical protein [Hymenobacter sp. HSC-4F20]MBX0289611.1 hypothetical protein [Hymenobacter sp. HSC-4F20]